MPRAKFNSSRLVRLLAADAVHASPEAAGSKQDFAERLAQWLDVTDAIGLFAAVNSGAVQGGRPPAAANSAWPAGVAIPAATAGLDADVARLRAAIAESIATDTAFRAARGREAAMAPASAGRNAPLAEATNAGEAGDAASEAARESARESAVGEAADFTPWHRAYRAHQRRMEAAIGPLRTGVRDALGRQCPALRPLAEIDAALEKALEARQRLLMSRVPQLLEKRFEHLCATQAGAGDWLAGFRSDMQEVLLAELDVRLQPVEGLIEAIRNEVNKQE